MGARRHSTWGSLGSWGVGSCEPSYETKLGEWQLLNTTLFDHVLPMLIIDGVTEKQDQEAIDELIAGQLCDGRGLVSRGDGACGDRRRLGGGDA